MVSNRPLSSRWYLFQTGKSATLFPGQVGEGVAVVPVEGIATVIIADASGNTTDLDLRELIAPIGVAVGIGFVIVVYAGYRHVQNITGGVVGVAISRVAARFPHQLPLRIVFIGSDLGAVLLYLGDISGGVVGIIEVQTAEIGVAVLGIVHLRHQVRGSASAQRLVGIASIVDSLQVDGA